MPLFEYRCRKCGEVTEHLQKTSDAPPEKCSRCGGTLERILSAPSIHGGGAEGNPVACNRSSPCCGRDVPCGAPPCGGKR